MKKHQVDYEEECSSSFNQRNSLIMKFTYKLAEYSIDSSTIDVVLREVQLDTGVDKAGRLKCRHNLCLSSSVVKSNGR